MFYEMERTKDESLFSCGIKWNHKNQSHNSKLKLAPKPCMQHTPVRQVKGHASDMETNGDMPFLKVWLQDILEETTELTTDTVFKASG